MGRLPVEVKRPRALLIARSKALGAVASALSSVAGSRQSPLEEASGSQLRWGDPDRSEATACLLVRPRRRVHIGSASAAAILCPQLGRDGKGAGWRRIW